MPVHPLDVRIRDRRTRATALEICKAVRDAGGRAHLVGGCVRDAVLDRPVLDVDIECFGLPVDELESLVSAIAPVSLVGASFGVFKVHGLPIDVSVPRRERKVGTGHRGFEIEADPFLDPAQAAARRDFTVNAIAWDPLERSVVDPFDGLGDLERGLLRHTSHQFAEDPLRVLRGMQFVARFGLTPDPATVALCRGIDAEGLAAERIYDEWRKLVCNGVQISAGLRFLHDTTWLRYFPELAALVDVPQDPQWHPEGDVWVHTGHVMDCFAEDRDTIDAHDRDGRRVEDWEHLVVGFACLCHDLGKPPTTAFTDGRWRSPGHEEAGLAPTRTFLGRMTSQHRLIEEVLPLVADHLKPDQLFQQGSGAAAVRRLAKRVGRLDRLLRVARADRRGRPPAPWDGFPAAVWLLETAAALDVLTAPPEPIVKGRDLIGLGLTPGPGFKPLLDACYEAQLDGRIADLEEGLAFVRAATAPE